jgi:spermidine synthase
MDSARKVFPVVRYAWSSVPTYPSGQIGFLICSNDAQIDPSKPRFTFSKEFETSKLKYYDANIHEAAFVLPGFARRVLES